MANEKMGNIAFAVGKNPQGKKQWKRIGAVFKGQYDIELNLSLKGEENRVWHKATAIRFEDGSTVSLTGFYVKVFLDEGWEIVRKDSNGSVDKNTPHQLNDDIPF